MRHLGQSLAFLLASIPAWSAPVEFRRDILPILSENCFTCHGPDEKARKSGLRLDVRNAAVGPAKSGAVAIVPGNAAKSESYLRVTAKDAENQMPPDRTGKRLSAAQTELLRRWIEEGAKYETHWAFVPPALPPRPALKARSWARGALDEFVQVRLEAQGLAPSPEAGRPAWLRRVTLDLTGLPPTLTELNAFLADTSTNAHEKVVDRLLASPRYGERMAIGWLEAARYADTSGYQTDGDRTMWRWRDWVIDAFNRNLPYDQFTVEQLAGDLLPGATLSQRIATGFNRNHRGNAEGGIIPAEYAVEYVVDRVDTTATVWLGLTMGCARCHDHKYDPLTQREFYQLFAFFNNVPEKGRAVKIGNSPPMVVSPTDAQAKELAALDARLEDARRRWRAQDADGAQAQRTWEQTLATSPDLDWALTDGLLARFPLDGTLERTEGNHSAAKAREGDARFVEVAVGRGRALALGGTRYLDCGDVGDFGFLDKFTVAAQVRPDGARGGAILSRMIEQDADSGFASDSEGYSVHLKEGRVQVYLTKRWLDDALRVETEKPLSMNEWHHIAVSYDGSRVAAGVRIYVDGILQNTRVLLDELNQTFATKQPLRVGAGGGPAHRFHGAIADVRVYGRVLTGEEAAAMGATERLAELVMIPISRRSPSQIAKLRLAFLDRHAPEALRAAHRGMISLERERDAFIEGLPTTMVMQELPIPRESFVLHRGEYDKPGERVQPGFPAALGAPPPQRPPRNRLDFARWLISPEHPLTARVAVNHAWQLFFGAGLVRTPEDFGAQGEPPTHPELLDWLAREFVRTGWDLKGLHKLIVLSATYRQSSRVTPALQARDPDNRLLARASRLRLPAEMIRDQALFASGLLVEKVGGPSVMPYQPAGLWKELSGTDHVPGRGEDLWRRSLYTFWKRTSPPPMMMTFDAAGREACSVRRPRTSTPLQALALMNDVTYVEAARKLSERAFRNGGATPATRLAYAFRLVMARTPQPTELDILLAGYEQQRARFAKDPKAATALMEVGHAPRDASLPVVELAAFTAAANLILNLDEAMTRP